MALTIDSLMSLVVAASLLLLPGLVVGMALGLRGWAAWGAAPALSVGQLVIAVLFSVIFGVRWSPGIALAIWLVTVLVVVALRLRGIRSRGGGHTRRLRLIPVWSRSRGPWAVLAGAGVAAGAGLGALVVVRGTGQLRAPNQGFDALFHVNVVEAILRTGDVSPAIAGTLNGYPTGSAIYPDGLHALAALIAAVHGSSVTAVNALMACIPLVVGLGLASLLWSYGLRREAAVVPLVVAATTGYPFDLIWRGPIWVYAFGIALIPSFLVLLRNALGRRRVGLTAFLGISSAGVALVHPSAALSGGVFAACLIAQRWLARRRAFRRDISVLLPSVVLAGALALPLIWKALVASGGGTIVDWPAVQTPGAAVGGLLLFNYETAFPQIFLAIVALIGLALLNHRPMLRWWAAGTAAFGFLCVLAASYEGWVVVVLTGPWWNDRFRFEGLVFVGLAVFAAVGTVAVADQASRAILALLRAVRRLPAVRPRLVEAAALVIVAVFLGTATGGFYAHENIARLENAYGPFSGGSVTPGDRAAYRVLAKMAGDGPVLNDPNDGSAWMWPLAGVRPVFGAALTFPVAPPLVPERQVLIDGLNCLDSSAAVRRSVENLGVRYVFVANGTILAGPTPTRGFHDLADVVSLRPVYKADGVTIYRIDLGTPLAAAPIAACQQRGASD